MQEEHMLGYYDFLCTLGIAVYGAEGTESNGKIVIGTCRRLLESGRFAHNPYVTASMNKAVASTPKEVWRVFKTSIREYCQAVRMKAEFVEERMSQAS